MAIEKKMQIINSVKTRGLISLQLHCIRTLQYKKKFQWFIIPKGIKRRRGLISNVVSSAFSRFSAHLLLFSRRFVFYTSVHYFLWAEERTQCTQNYNFIQANSASVACHKLGLYYNLVCDDLIKWVSFHKKHHLMLLRQAEFNKCKKMMVAHGHKTGVLKHREPPKGLNVNV